MAATRSTATGRPAGQRPKGRAADRRPPERVPGLAHLGLDELRAYRAELAEEESRVSYWRRILQAKLDLLVAEDAPELVLRLRHVLADAERASRRQVLLRVHPAEGMPPLPNLHRLWTEEPERSSAAARQELADAEHNLSVYRSALLDRLDAATGDLIARYRDEPSACLAALPA